MIKGDAVSIRQNLELARRNFETRATVLDNSPTRLTIETTAICNLRCVMCPHSFGGVDRPNHMPLELFEKMVEPMARAERAQLHGIGEPLASPALWRAVENNYFDVDAALTINTNLTLLNERRLQKLMEVQARFTLNVSLDAATAATYKRIRGGEFSEVITNISRLLAKRRDAEHPAIYMNMTLMRENIGEAVAFVELAKRLGVDAVCFWHLNRLADAEMARYNQSRDGWSFDYAEQGLWNEPRLSDQTLRKVLERARELEMTVWFDESKITFFETENTAAPEPAPAAPAPVAAPAPAPLETVKDCSLPWDSFILTSDGIGRPCCYSKPVGNIKDGDFQSLWNGPTMQELRADTAENCVHAVCRGASCKYVANTPEPPAEPWTGERIALTAAAGEPIAAPSFRSFHAAEDWGRWTDGERAEIAVNIAASPRPPKRLLLDINALAPRGPQRLAIAIDGVERHAVDLADSGDAVVACPLPAGLAGPVEIGLSTSYASSPRDWGSDDARQLGVGLRGLSLEF